MPAVPGPEFLADPDEHAKRFVVQMKAEAAALTVAPPRYEWMGHYWCVVKSNTGWPNVTGWAEHRAAQQIFGPRLDELMAAGVPKDEAWQQAKDYAFAEMLVRTTERKETSDLFYAQLEADIAREAGEDGTGD